MHYCGVVPHPGALQLAVLEEVRTHEPPIRLSALFFEPGGAEQVAAELRALGDVVLARRGAAVGARDGDAPERARRPARGARRGAPAARTRELARLAALLDGMAAYRPRGRRRARAARCAEGAYRAFPLFETNADGVFCALQGRRLPAKRHPLGMQLRIEELAGRPRDRRRRRALAPPHRGARGGGLRPLRPPLRRGPRLLARRAPGDGRDRASRAPRCPNEFPRAGVLPPVERLQLPPGHRAA